MRRGGHAGTAFVTPVKMRGQKLLKWLVRLAVLALIALTAWAAWVGAQEIWRLQSRVRVNNTTKNTTKTDECIKMGQQTRGSQAEVCPDKK